MRVNQAFKRAVQQNASSDATVYRSVTRTWGELGERVPRVAGHLRGMGVTDGERVAVLAMNSDLYLELFFATPWAGGVIVPLNTRWSTAELAEALVDCGATVLVIDDVFAPVLDELLERSGTELTVIGLGDEGAADARYAELAEAGDPVEESPREGDDLYGIFYTGGTTGASRGVMLSHRNLMTCSLMWIASLFFHSETRYIHSVGFFHLAGAAPAVALTLAGGAHVLLPKFTAEEVLSTVESERVNYGLFVPTMINMLFNHEKFHKYDLSSLRDIEYGASPMPVALLERALAELPNVNFRQGYGCTEATALVTCLEAKYHKDPRRFADKLKSAGRAAPGAEVRIVDENRREVPRGTVGEIAIAGDSVMLGYWNRPEETKAVLEDGWLYSGDGAWMDDEGFVHIVDRVKDMIVSGGENVYSSEVEQALYKHDAVLECAVIGIPHEQWGEAVHAVVVLKNGMSAGEEELIRHCHDLIAGYKCPKTVEIRAEPLPLTAAGKIKKNELRTPYWQSRDRKVN